MYSCSFLIVIVIVPVYSNAYRNRKQKNERLFVMTSAIVWAVSMRVVDMNSRIRVVICDLRNSWCI